MAPKPKSNPAVDGWFRGLFDAIGLNGPEGMRRAVSPPPAPAPKPDIRKMKENGWSDADIQAYLRGLRK
jgi:hypothetical protein